jgi:hypothetical protein
VQSSRRPVTPRQASITGVAFIALGAWLIFAGTGRPHIVPARGVPLWMVSLAGAMFTCGGGAMLLRYRGAGATATRLLQLLLSSATTGCLGAMFAWVAFGPGPRHFIARSNVPVFGTSSERLGRVAFGIAAVCLAFALAAQFVSGVRMLRR